MSAENVRESQPKHGAVEEHAMYTEEMIDRMHLQRGGGKEQKQQSRRGRTAEQKARAQLFDNSFSEPRRQRCVNEQRAKGEGDPRVEPRVAVGEVIRDFRDFRQRCRDGDDLRDLFQFFPRDVFADVHADRNEDKHERQHGKMRGREHAAGRIRRRIARRKQSRFQYIPHSS